MCNCNRILGLGHGPCCLEAWALGVHPLLQLVCDSCDLLWVGFTDWLGGCCAEAWGVMLVGALGSCFKIFPIATWWIPGYCHQPFTWWGMSLHQLGLPFHCSGPLCCNSILVVSVSLLNPYIAQIIATWFNDIWNLGLVSMTWQGLVSVSTWCQLSLPEGTGFTILFELFNFLVLQFGLCMCWRLIGSFSRQWFINSCMVMDTWIIRPGYLHIAYPSCPYGLSHFTFSHIAYRYQILIEITIA